MLEKFTSDEDPKKSILEFLSKKIGNHPKDSLKIKMGVEDWAILRRYGGPGPIWNASDDVLDIETSGPLLKAGIRGYLWGFIICVDDRKDIVVDPWT